MKKGEQNEKNLSNYFHNRFIPVLISPKLLRELGAGQVDIAYLKKNPNWQLKLIEVKSRSYPSPGQWQRLRKAQDYLSKVLECETILEVKFCQKDLDSLS
jgi:hypothetical protein